MVGEWQEFALGALTENFDSIRVPVKGTDRRSGPYPYYGASGIVDHIDDYIFDGEYLLVAEDGENLRTRNTPVAFLANGKFWVNNHAHIVRGNDRADTRFLRYSLAATNISGYLTGSTMPKLTQGNLKRIRIIAPPIAEQREIAHILGTLDDKIELNRRMNETLEAMAQAIFKSWFVNFDPVRAKAAGRDPALPKPIAALFPDSFEDSELGKIPGGWEISSLEGLVKLGRESINPGSFKKEIFNHYSIPAFDDGKVPKKEKGKSIKSNKYLVSAQAVLLSKLNPRFPRIWLPDIKADYRSICSTEFLVALPTAAISREFIYCLFSSQTFLKEFETLTTGTSGSHQRVKPASMLAMKFVRAPQKVVVAFSQIVCPKFSQVALLQSESRTLAALRDTLLPKLISGELRVG